MSHIRTWSRVLLSFATVGTVMTAVVVGATTQSASAITNPPNTPWTYAGLGQCNMKSSAISAHCLTSALTDFNRARHKEHLGPMKLPANFRSMSVPMQMLTLTNIDRTSRGLAPFAALSQNLNKFTQPAANQGRDVYPWPSWARQAGGNWAGTRNALWAEYLWMYDDGPGGTNLDCTRAGQLGCWGHRDNVLRSYGGPRILGASVGSNGIATLMMGMDTHDWNLLTPNAPRSLAIKESTGHRVQATWAAPAARGTAVRGYYVKRDSGPWMKVTARSWTSRALPLGSHAVSVKSFNARGSSPIRTVHIVVK